MMDDDWRPDPKLPTRQKIVAIIERHAVDGVAQIGPSGIARLVGISSHGASDLLMKMTSSGELVRVAAGMWGITPQWRIGIPREAVIHPEFSAEMDQTVKAMWAHKKTDQQIARWLGVPIDAVTNRRGRLKLRRRDVGAWTISPKPPPLLDDMQAPVRQHILAEPIDLDAALSWARRNGVPDDEGGDPPRIEAINARRRAYGLIPWTVRRRTSPMGALPHPGPVKIIPPEKSMGQIGENRGRPRSDDPPEVRFWKGVSKGGDDECWRFTNTGTLTVSGRKITMRWFSLILHHGDAVAPDGRRPPTKTTCRQPDCVNPRHLRVVYPAARVAEAAD